MKTPTPRTPPHHIRPFRKVRPRCHFSFGRTLPSPIHHKIPSPVPDGAKGGFDQTIQDLNPEPETDPLLQDSHNTPVSVEFRTPDSIEQFDATIYLITEQLENLVAQRDHELQKAISPEEVGEVIARTQSQALQL